MDTRCYNSYCQPAGSAPAGLPDPIQPPKQHTVLRGSMCSEDFPGAEVITLGMGCFWGAERRFWQLKGVLSTAVGYAGGDTVNPSYELVCTGLTGHSEVVQVVFDPQQISLTALLSVFWQSHDPTQGMRQGADIGSQYRSAIYASSEQQMAKIEASYLAYQTELKRAGFGDITTEVDLLKTFYFAEAYHQQYLDKNPGGYCGLKGTGVQCIIS